MRKSILITLLIAIAMIAIVTTAMAITFDGRQGTISATTIEGEAVISVTGVGDIRQVEQYMSVKDSEPKIYNIVNGRVTIDPAKGDRFQLLNAAHEYLYISPEWCNSNHRPVKLEGVSCDFATYPKGALQLD